MILDAEITCYDYSRSFCTIWFYKGDQYEFTQEENTSISKKYIYIFNFMMY